MRHRRGAVTLGANRSYDPVLHEHGAAFDEAEVVSFDERLWPRRQGKRGERDEGGVVDGIGAGVRAGYHVTCDGSTSSK